MPTRSVPAVSIVLPTFNRADVIGRAIDSVRRQSFQDWELLIVDDGSTDGTAALLEGLDPRLVIIRQENAGVYSARNNGLLHARGRFITFLDSDDAWAPHYLELSAAFLAHHPEAAFVTTEFWEDWGQGPAVKHDLYEVRQKYPRQAKAIGSTLFSLPPDETDDYLRLYTWRAPVGDWGRAALAQAGLDSAYVYRGHIFAHMRFGYLNWLPTTMLTRAALDAVGPFATNTRSAADYGFLGRLARAFPANMIAVPGATKFDRSTGGQQLRQDHLASGAGSYQFARDLLSHFEALPAARRSRDRGAAPPSLPQDGPRGDGRRAPGRGARAAARGRSAGALPLARLSRPGLDAGGALRPDARHRPAGRRARQRARLRRAPRRDQPGSGRSPSPPHAVR
ncbi:MAG TPA: glycosyltransferase family 2 protein [Polyangia bacterium]|nr:glycosyltransferase family 2 protein [Polyangia bacterium]